MKNFIFRSVPEELHAQWKFFAKHKGSSMRRYLLVALKRQIDKDKEGIKNERG
jgi:hypothetical protein